MGCLGRSGRIGRFREWEMSILETWYRRDEICMYIFEAGFMLQVRHFSSP